MDILDKRIVKVMQNGFPIVKEPYKQMAKEIGISEDELIKRINNLKQGGQIRKMGAVLGHYTAGYCANVLCAWIVPKDKMDEIAKSMAKNPAVSHCYDRSVTKDWPYNIYTMIHAKSRAECDAIADTIAKENNLEDRVMLYSVKEWKKTSMKYFEENKLAQ